MSFDPQYFYALKAHFTSAYNAPQYNFKLKRRVERDKYQQQKLARHPDPKGLVIANLIIDPKIWIGQLFEQTGQQNYHAWKRYHDSLPYHFSQEILHIHKDWFRVSKHEHPYLLRLYLGKKIRLETMIILDDLLQYAVSWRVLDHDVIWKNTNFMMEKYRCLFEYNLVKVKQIVLDKRLSIR